MVKLRAKASPHIRYYRDPHTELPHIYEHDVTQDEVEEALRSRHEDRGGEDGARVAIGRTRLGRILRIIYVRDAEPNAIFVITAYELRGKALVAYRRRQRRKPQ